MNKQAISVSLDPDNLLWLRTRAVSLGCRSVSEMLDRLIHDARSGGKGQGNPVRSVMGTIQIAESDPGLSTADSAVRALFPVALRRRPASVRGRTRPKRVGRRAVPAG